MRCTGAFRNVKDADESSRLSLGVADQMCPRVSRGTSVEWLEDGLVEMCVVTRVSGNRSRAMNLHSCCDGGEVVQERRTLATTLSPLWPVGTAPDVSARADGGGPAEAITRDKM